MKHLNMTVLNADQEQAAAQAAAAGALLLAATGDSATEFIRAII